MIVASGFIETNEIKDVEVVVDELKKRGFEINDVKDEKIVFVLERETAAEVKKELDSLKDIDSIKNVYLAYFSLEDADQDK